VFSPIVARLKPASRADVLRKYDELNRGAAQKDLQPQLGLLVKTLKTAADKAADADSRNGDDVPARKKKGI
jgi:hypothetical protein